MLGYSPANSASGRSPSSAPANPRKSCGCAATQKAFGGVYVANEGFTPESAAATLTTQAGPERESCQSRSHSGRLGSGLLSRQCAPHVRKAILGDRYLLGARGEQFVHRPFKTDMSLSTVFSLSFDWHDVVAANMTGPNFKFPEPWCPGGIFGGFDVVPITSNSDLYREGKLLHHCVGTCVGSVRSGECYVFSVRKDCAPVARLELVRGEAGVAIGPFRGACKATVSSKVRRAANSWLEAQRDFRFPQQRPKDLSDELFDGIPF